MSPEKKKELTETAVGRIVEREVKEELAKLQRPSRAMKAVSASLDVTEKYPVASWCLGVGFVAASLMYLDGPKLYIGAGIGVCFVPGLARKVIGLAAGLKKAKGDS